MPRPNVPSTGPSTPLTDSAKGHPSETDTRAPSSQPNPQQLHHKLDQLGTENGFDPAALRDGLARAHHLKGADQGASRAALLMQIDRLAHGGRRALFALLIAWVALAIAIIMFSSLWWGGRTMIKIILLWSILMLAAGWPLTHSLQRYHRGGSILRKPFSWRANLTARLGVFGFAFAAGPWILAADGVSSSPYALEAFAGLVALIGLITSLMLTAQRPASAALLGGISLALLLTPLALFGHHQLLITLDGLGLWSLFALTLACLMGLVWQKARLEAARTLFQHPRRETFHITAGHKPASQAYNPYRLKKLSQQNKPSPPSSTVEGDELKH